MEKTFNSRPPAHGHSGVRMYQHWSSCRKCINPLFLGPTFTLGFPSRFSTQFFVCPSSTHALERRGLEVDPACCVDVGGLSAGGDEDLLGPEGGVRVARGVGELGQAVACELQRRWSGGDHGHHPRRRFACGGRGSHQW